MSAQPAAVSDPIDASHGLLKRFDGALAEEGVEIELCVVGGAVIQLAFAAQPESRRPRSLFAPPGDAGRARRKAAERGKVPLDRLEDAARALAGGSEGEATSYDGRALRVFAAPPDYVLAMKCCGLAFVDDGRAEDDIRYLLRFLGLRSTSEVLTVIEPYLNPRQRPVDLASRLDAILG